MKAEALLRIGDVYPDNMVQLAVRMYLYRWNDRLQEDATTAPYEARPPLCAVTLIGKRRICGTDSNFKIGCAGVLGQVANGCGNNQHKHVNVLTHGS